MNLPRTTPVSTGEKVANVIMGVIIAAILVTAGIMFYCLLTNKI